jgi:hypothetical protein
MAGIFDEVMDAIAAKEKRAPPPAPGTTPPAAAGTPPATPPAPGEQTPAPATEERKGMHEYSDQFKAKYGGPENGA